MKLSIKLGALVASALILSGCGGGEVNCTASGACVVNVGSVTTGPITTPNPPSPPASGASAPSGGASSPDPTPPISAVPLARPKPIPPAATIYPGDLRWSAQGITYLATVATSLDFAWVAIYSVPSATANGGEGLQVAAFEVALDNGLGDRNVQPNETAVRAYLQTHVVPALDTWIKANSGRWASGMVVYPVNSGGTPTGNGIDHVAARLAQWVEVKPTGATLK